MKKQHILVLLFGFLLVHKADTQPPNDSCTLQISLLTCTPGAELYSTFGHSALRVVDANNSMDIVFNYGSFDFDDPDFYKKFVSGQLLYFVSTSTLEDFLSEYRYFKRGVTEQYLDLSCEQKKTILTTLLLNAEEANKYYRYNFTHDNCTTRLRDMIEKSIGGTIMTKNILPANAVSYRTLLHQYLDAGKQHWSKFGIDILLGARLDKKITNREAMFLPDYLLKAMDSAAIGGRPAVLRKMTLVSFEQNNKDEYSIFRPVYVFGFLFLVVLIASFAFYHKTKKLFKIFDVAFFILLAFTGILLLYMWLGTNHPMCKYNHNILWALPLHLVSAFLIFWKNEFTRKYFLAFFLYTIALLIGWYLLPQQMHPACIFITGIMLVRTYCNARKN